MKKLEEFLLEKGYNPGIKGFDCLVTAIRLVRKNNEYKLHICKHLYPEIAEMLGYTASKVERALRHMLSSTKNEYEMYTNSRAIATMEILTRHKYE